jgi:hypothetical protein
MRRQRISVAKTGINNNLVNNEQKGCYNRRIAKTKRPPRAYSGSPTNPAPIVQPVVETPPASGQTDKADGGLSARASASPISRGCD